MSHHRPIINILWVHIIALLGCSAYLAGSLVFSMMDKTDYSCLVMETDPGLYYKPMALMQLALIWLGFKSTEQINPTAKDCIHEIWRFYLWLAISQVVKMFFTNPMIESVVEYVFLGVAMIYLCINFFKLYKRHKLHHG